MHKCTGVCSTCGRCQNAAMMRGANDRKTKMVNYPDDFQIEKVPGAWRVAFDIGTTTVVGMLWNMESGDNVATCAKTNPQNEHGMDVISRITFCGPKGENLDVLRGKIIACLNEIIEELCKEAAIESTEISIVSVCGNTTMSHLFSGNPPMTLALAPFKPYYTGTLVLSAETSMLNIAPAGTVILVPNIAGHVGGDTTAGIVAGRILDQTGTTVFIDIGTNGEIVVTDGKDAYACSTAAGPAFEGAEIYQGMRAAVGAIEKIKIVDGDVLFKTIGECEPQGICGSGLIDAIAQMIEHKLINKMGRLISREDAAQKGMSEEIQERLSNSEDKPRKFVLVFKEKGEDIVVTQNDIREVQLAKGAIAAGLKIMLQKIGKETKDIDRVIVAGAFGNYIDKESAVTMGILPKIEYEKIIFAGNTAGAGVSMIAVSDAELELAKEIPERVKHVELADSENFQDIYLGSMSF